MTQTPLPHEAQEQKSAHHSRRYTWLHLTLLNVVIFPGWLYVLQTVAPWLLESLDMVFALGRILLTIGSFVSAVILGAVYIVRTKNEGLPVWKRYLPLSVPLIMLGLLLYAVSAFLELHPT